MVNISNFQTKDVVNLTDGKRLGNIGDLDIDLHTGKIESIIIPNGGKMLSFLRKDDNIIIPWRDIVKVGEDIILVRYNHAELDQMDMDRSIYRNPPTK